MRQKRLLFWFVYTAILPLVFVSVVWAIERLIVRTDSAFTDVFGTGDLIPLAVLLIFGVLADMRLAGMERSTTVGMIINELWFMLVALTLLMLYGAIKVSAVTLLKANDPNATARLALYAQFSWALMIYSITHATFIKLNLVDSPS
jgi:hypothetical protein